MDKIEGLQGERSRDAVCDYRFVSSMTISNWFSCFSGAQFPVVSWERVHKKFLFMSKMLACLKMLLLYYIYLPESSVEYGILGWKSPAFWKHCIVVFLASIVGCGEVQNYSVPLYVTWFFFLEACRIFCLFPVLFCFTKTFVALNLFSLILVGTRNSCFLFYKIFLN